jgi:pyrroline-5-carboxylate reductase
MKLGFIGTGTMTSAMVAGLSSGGAEFVSVVLSPRNSAVSADLARRLPRTVVAVSNQDVLDRCETVVLAVRPQIAKGVLSELKFRVDHHVISIMAAFDRQKLCELVAPATRVTRAVPLPSAAKRRSPTAIYPRDRAALDLFLVLGPAFEVDTEEEFDALCAATATIASYFAFADSVASWLARRGVPQPRAGHYVAQMFAELMKADSEGSNPSFQALAAEHATAGGINDQALRYLAARGLFESISEALDAVMHRIRTASQQE